MNRLSEKSQQSVAAFRLLPAIVVAALTMLAGCATPRPDPGLSCNLHGQAVSAPVNTMSGVRPRSIPDFDKADTQIARDLRSHIRQNYEKRQDVKRQLRHEAPVLPGALSQAAGYVVLVLSAGGQFGAYGSGFLKGWGDQSTLSPARADVDMITGVSTGAMMATYAYLGSSDDKATRARYGDLAVPTTTTKNNLIGVVGRTALIASDQLVLDAAYYVDSEATRLKFTTRWTSAANTGCEAQSSDDMLSPALGLCLWETGFKRASSEPSPWKDFSKIRQP